MTGFKVVSDPVGVNQALFEITHGLYILTSSRGEKLNGQCLDAAMRVANAPPRIAIGVGKKSLTHEMIADAGKFALNAIDKTAPDWPALVRHFGFQSGRDVDKFADFGRGQGGWGERGHPLGGIRPVADRRALGGHRPNAFGLGKEELCDWESC